MLCDAMQDAPKRRACFIARLPLTAVLMALTGQAVAIDSDCAGLRRGEGPWDYNNPADGEMLALVERAHFDRDVESLVRGSSSADLMSDIDYTLRRFPNHPRALFAMSNYYLLDVDRYTRDGWQPPECYFRLAIQWRPTDGMVWMVYAIFLHRVKEWDAAADAYDKAIEIMPDAAEAHYNLGLLRVDMGDMSRAREQALIAYRLGYPLPGLKDILRRRGVWNQSDDGAPGTGAPAASDTSR